MCVCGAAVGFFRHRFHRVDGVGGHTEWHRSRSRPKKKQKTHHTPKTLCRESDDGVSFAAMANHSAHCQSTHQSANLYIRVYFELNSSDMDAMQGITHIAGGNDQIFNTVLPSFLLCFDTKMLNTMAVAVWMPICVSMCTTERACITWYMHSRMCVVCAAFMFVG